MIISIVVDNDSWILPYAETLLEWSIKQGFDALLARSHADIQKGDCAFFLGCIKIVAPDVLDLNTHNLVVHESELPAGRGFAPMTWQILEGKNIIPVCLLEAAEGEVDSGDIFLQETIDLEGHELCQEWRDKQGKKTIALCQQFLEEYPHIRAQKQEGIASNYSRRYPEHSALDVDKTIAEQFDLLRVVDNERYPAFFTYKEHRYILKIEKATDE